MKCADPVLCSVFHFIEVIFHLGGKFRINDLLEVILHKIGDNFA